MALTKLPLHRCLRLFFSSLSHTPRFKQSTLCSTYSIFEYSVKGLIANTFTADSTFLRKKKPKTTQTVNNTIPPTWGESTSSFPSTFHQRHHINDDLYLNGLFADHSLFHSKEKMHINVVVIGHVDSGKSTTTGKQQQSLDVTFEQPTHKLYRPLDLQVRRNRQAYHREVREGKHFEFFIFIYLNFPSNALSQNFAPRWGRFRFPQATFSFFAPGQSFGLDNPSLLPNLIIIYQQHIFIQC